MDSPEILVTSYVDPDLDGFACAFAYVEFLSLTGHPAALGLNHHQNIFVTDDKAAQELLQSILYVEFADNIAFRPGFIMRKEIMPLIKAKLK